MYDRKKIRSTQNVTDVSFFVVSSYDIYMVDTPKESDGDEATEDNPLEKQSRPRRHRRRSKPCHSKNSDTDTGDDNNPNGAEDENNLAQPSFEQA